VARHRSRFAYAVVIGVMVAGAAALLWWIQWRQSHPRTALRYTPRPSGTLTFTKDIAPLVFSHCAPCHRPGQAAPFSLLTYADVKRRAKQIAEVTGSRYMPPWLPEPGYGEFAQSHRLTDEQLGLLQQWLAEGGREGAPADLPPAPRWTEGWQLGPPDLVVTLPRAYTLAAEGRDVFRNFVLPVPITEPRYVRAIELNPGNRRILHHARIKVDRTPQSRHLDEQDVTPGFPGLSSPGEMPGGHFLTWQPGRSAAALPDGLSWRLEPGSDLVLESHLNPSGKPEPFQPSVGLYFTERPPTNTCFKMALPVFLIDIPPGQKDCVVRTDFTLPADADLLAVMPHAHFLARDVQGWATLPNGTKQWLIWIRQWDFNWQTDYRYATPLFLPKGATLHMQFTFDNSDANPRNPHHPPRRVRYGLQSVDEMPELWLQFLPRHEADRAALAKAYEEFVNRQYVRADEYNVRVDPNDAKAHIGLGKRLPAQGRAAEAMQHLLTAARLQPKNDEPHYYLGALLRQQHRLAEAEAAFEAALRLNPKNYRAHGTLGFICQEQGRLEEAIAHYQAALRINPYDELAKSSLEEVLRAQARQVSP
jgi:Tfp pilus assembly protein PilF